MRRAGHPCSDISHTASSARTVCKTTRAVVHPARFSRRSAVLGEIRLHARELLHAAPSRRLEHRDERGTREPAAAPSATAAGESAGRHSLANRPPSRASAPAATAPRAAPRTPPAPPAPATPATHQPSAAPPGHRPPPAIGRARQHATLSCPCAGYRHPSPRHRSARPAIASPSPSMESRYRNTAT